MITKIKIDLSAMFTYGESRLSICINKIYEKHLKMSDVFLKKIVVVNLYLYLGFHSSVGLYHILPVHMNYLVSPKV